MFTRIVAFQVLLTMSSGWCNGIFWLSAVNMGIGWLNNIATLNTLCRSKLCLELASTNYNICNKLNYY